MKITLKKLMMLLIATCSFTCMPGRAAPKPGGFRLVDGVIHDTTALSSTWRMLQGEAVAFRTNGTLIRTFSMQIVYGALPERTRTVRSRLEGSGSIPRPVIGHNKVYGKTVLVMGHHNVIVQKDMTVLAMPAGLATINGVRMEVWKPGTVPTTDQVRK